MVKFKEFLNEGKNEEYIDLLDDVAALLDTAGDQYVWVKKTGSSYIVIELSGENYIESKITGSEKDVIKTQKIFKDGEVVNYDLAITRLKELKTAIENEQFIGGEEDTNEAQDPKEKQFKEMAKLASQIGKYGHRWGENASGRMTGWVSTYNKNKDNMKENGTWEEYCKVNGFSKSHDGYDCLG